MRIWLVGMYGAVATTTMVGAKAIEKGLIETTGLVSQLPDFEVLQKMIPLKFEFGGHEIRMLNSNAYEATYEHWEKNRHFDKVILEAIRPQLEKLKAKKGTAINCGSGIEDFGEIQTLEADGLTLREIVKKIEKDILKFKNGYDDTVVINVASTEPRIRLNPKYHMSLDGFETLLDEDRREYVTASMLYAYVALKNGIPYGNFTPSAGSSIPALKELAAIKEVPHAGNDGKTGETLVKTTLASMFLYRNLEVIGWMSFNILGDYDGMVLDHADNKESKIVSKDKVLRKILGYSPYTITEIRFFPSLVDNKTAFDFIHFKGFLGTKMKFYFVWDGIDAILAAPLVIDIARFLLFAKKMGVSEVVKEMAFFFKSPMETEIYDTSKQFEMLKNWYIQLVEGPTRAAEVLENVEDLGVKIEGYKGKDSQRLP